MTRKHSFLLLKSLSFSFSVSNSGYTYKSSLKTQNSGYKSFTKSSFKHKILVTTVYKKFLQTQNSGYSYKSSFKQNIPVTVTKVLQNKIFWLQLQKFLQTKYSGYIYKSSFKHNILVTVYKKFLHTQYSGYSLQKVPSNTKFRLQLQKFLQTKYSCYSYKISFNKILVTNFQSKFLNYY